MKLEFVERKRRRRPLIIIADGSIRAAGPREELRAGYTLPRFALEAEGDAAWLRDLPGVTVVDTDGRRVVFDLASGADDQ